MYSNETTQLINSHKGYRYECYGSGIRNIKEVAEYEAYELDNDDIADTLYNHCSDILSSSDMATLDKVIKSIRNEDYDTLEAVRDEYVNVVFKAAKLGTGLDKPLCLWLANKEAVTDLYLIDGDNDNINEYTIPENAFVLSDLGYYGTLLAMSSEDVF